jgi:hypothetical protein
MPLSEKILIKCQNCGKWISFPSLSENPILLNNRITKQASDKCSFCGSMIPRKKENMKIALSEIYEFTGDFTD